MGSWGKVASFIGGAALTAGGVALTALFPGLALVGAGMTSAGISGMLYVVTNQKYEFKSYRSSLAIGFCTGVVGTAIGTTIVGSLFSDCPKYVQKMAQLIIGAASKFGIKENIHKYQKDELGSSSLPLKIMKNHDTYDERGYTPLHMAAMLGDFNLANTLIQEGASANLVAKNEWRYTPLHEACRHNHINIVKLLLSNGADPSLKCYDGDALSVAISYKNRKIIALLDGSINAYDSVGYTPLHYAAMHSRYSEALHLVNMGGDVNAVARNQWRYTPVHEAFRHGCLEIAKLLLENGGDPNLYCNEGTALDAAKVFNSSHVVSFFRSNGWSYAGKTVTASIREGW